MPNTVPAAAEGLPAINRRVALLGGLAATTALVAAPRADAVEEGQDPLLEAIIAYREGLIDYNFNAPDENDAADAYVEVSYGPPFAVLQEWEAPAKTRRGAIEALRLISKENDDFAVSPITAPLLAAALAYFESES